jgi:hypothetical protein
VLSQVKPTANYIATIMDRITLPGAFFLAIAGILPGIAALLGVTSGFASFFGGTSMLIGVGVILDTLQQVESYLLMPLRWFDENRSYHRPYFNSYYRKKYFRVVFRNWELGQSVLHSNLIEL